MKQISMALLADFATIDVLATAFCVPESARLTVALMAIITVVVCVRA